MKVVEPIRSAEALARCFEIAAAHDSKRRKGDKLSWELLLVMGFNTGLRISDLVKLRVKDVRGQEYVRVVAQKTGKDTRLKLNRGVRRDIARLTEGRGGDEWLFQSRQRVSGTKFRKAISRQRAYQIINRVARAAGIEERIGCHTLRKTFGYHYYKQYHDEVGLQRILGHDNRRDTLVYIGITADEIDEKLAGFSLRRRAI
jgi:integrase